MPFPFLSEIREDWGNKHWFGYGKGAVRSVKDLPAEEKAEKQRAWFQEKNEQQEWQGRAEKKKTKG